MHFAIGKLVLPRIDLHGPGDSCHSERVMAAGLACYATEVRGRSQTQIPRHRVDQVIDENIDGSLAIVTSAQWWKPISSLRGTIFGSPPSMFLRQSYRLICPGVPRTVFLMALAGPIARARPCWKPWLNIKWPRLTMHVSRSWCIVSNCGVISASLDVFSVVWIPSPLVRVLRRFVIHARVCVTGAMARRSGYRQLPFG